MTVVRKLWRVPVIDEVIGDDDLIRRPNLGDIRDLILHYEVKIEETIESVDYFQVELSYDSSNESTLESQPNWTLLE